MNPPPVARTRSVALILGAALGLACGFPGLYFSSLPIFLKPVAAEFAWNRAATSAVAMASLLGITAAAPLVGWMMDRAGSRRIIGLSIVSFSAALLAFSLLPNSLVLFASTSFAVGALGVATGPNGYLFEVSRAFDRHLGLALSFAMLGVGIGAVVSPLVAQSLLSASGWRFAYRELSLAALLLGCVALALVLCGPQRSAAPTDALPVAAGDSLAEAARTRIFWTVVCVAALVAASGLGAAVHLSALLSDRGLSNVDGARVISASGAGIMAGRLLSGVCMDAVFAPLVGAAALLLGAMGVWLIGVDGAKTLMTLGVSAGLLGFAIGTEGDFFAFVARRYFGLKSFGSIYGVIFAIYCLGGVIGPVLFGVGFDRSGNYAVVMCGSAVGLVISALAVLTLGPYRYGKIQ